jgi:hypothetical protein
MDRASRNLFAVALVVVIAVTGGAALILGGAPRSDPGGGGAPATDSATGVIVAVDGESLGEIRGFTLRLDGGALLEFSLRALENGDVFPPAHMLEHQATADPVLVWYREADGELLAIRVDDAEAP